jgi:hypothetical protein
MIIPWGLDPRPQSKIVTPPLRGQISYLIVFIKNKSDRNSQKTAILETALRHLPDFGWFIEADPPASQVLWFLEAATRAGAKTNSI